MRVFLRCLLGIETRQRRAQPSPSAVVWASLFGLLVLWPAPAGAQRSLCGSPTVRVNLLAVEAHMGVSAEVVHLEGPCETTPRRPARPGDPPGAPVWCTWPPGQGSNKEKEKDKDKTPKTKSPQSAPPPPSATASLPAIRLGPDDLTIRHPDGLLLIQTQQPVGCAWRATVMVLW